MTTIDDGQSHLPVEIAVDQALVIAVQDAVRALRHSVQIAQTAEGAAVARALERGEPIDEGMLATIRSMVDQAQARLEQITRIADEWRKASRKSCSGRTRTIDRLEPPSSAPY